jgi:hypothetical protein
VRVQQIGVDTPRRADEACEQRREEEREPRAPAQIAEGAMPIRDRVVPELLRPDHLDLDTAGAYTLDCIGDEAPCRIVG